MIFPSSVACAFNITKDAVFLFFSLSVINTAKLVSTIKEGESFGEHALMNNSPRNNTIVSASDCKLWVLKRSVFRKILEFIFTLNYEQNKKFLEGINIPLDSTIKAIMANNLIQEIYKAGQYIFKEGELGGCMYIIKEGEVECITRRCQKVLGCQGKNGLQNVFNIFRFFPNAVRRRFPRATLL